MAYNMSIKKEYIHNYLIVLLLFFITVNTTISFLISFFILLLWFLNGNLKQRLKTILHDKLSLTFLSLFLINLIAILWSEDIHDGLKILSKQKIYLFAPILISFMDKRYIKYALMGLFSSIFISEIYSVYLFISDKKHILESSYSPFMHHMHYSLILAFTFAYMINHIDLKKNGKWLNISYALFSFITIITLFINKGRIGQIAILPLLFILLVKKFKLSYIRSFFTTIFLSIFIFISAYNFSSNFKARVKHAKLELTSYVKENKRDSITCRFEMWRYAIKLGKKDPLIGIGTGDSIYEMTNLLGKKQFNKLFYDCGLDMKYQFNPHNNFVLYFMQFGIIGVILLLFVIIYQFKIASKLHSTDIFLLLTVTLIGMMSTSLISMHIKYMFFYAFTLSLLYLRDKDNLTIQRL